MKLSELKLTNFKNYTTLHQSFSTPIVSFVGQNGEGKTNILDAIYYLCIGKSYLNSVDQQCIRHGTDFLRVEGHFEREDQKQDHIAVLSAKQKRKQIQKNKSQYERVADHLGFAPICFVAPDDAKLIIGGSEERRRFLTATLSQINPNYVTALTNYRKLLKQRTAHLKQEHRSTSLLDTYDAQMIPLGEAIHQIRQDYMVAFGQLVSTVYKQISADKEEVSCQYRSPLNKDNFKNLLTVNREKDLVLQRSTVGIHKDDLHFTIDGRSLKVYGSQGQQKTYLLALKIAELQLIAQHLGRPPIFLLDDIFDKLDSSRVAQLFQYILSLDFGQLFISDTNGERLYSLLSKFNRKFALFTVQNQQLTIYEK